MTLPRMSIPDSPTRPKKPCRSPAHLAWVRLHGCCVLKEHWYDHRHIEAAHVRTGTDGSMGRKPGDQWTISLCPACHREQHLIGEPAFERKYGIDMKALAQEFAAKSPKLKNRRKSA